MGRKVKLRQRFGRVKRGTRASFLRRNDPNWQARHPSSDSWLRVPPIPGTRIHQDLYVALTQPRRHGYADLEQGYAVFATKAKAQAGNPEDALVFHYGPSAMRGFMENYGPSYRFHNLVRLPSAHQRMHRFRRGAGR